MGGKNSRPAIIKHTWIISYTFRAARMLKQVRAHFSVSRAFYHQGFELSTKFPFGFFRHRRRLSAQEAEIIIFPKSGL